VAVERSVVGQTVSRSVVVIERGPLSTFARAVGDVDPVYHDRRAALAAGFTDVPAPPTWPFAMGFWGTLPEMQEGLEPVGPSPILEIMTELGPGLLLHGEQEFEYHRPILAGDVLAGEDTISDVSTKETTETIMTFVVTQSRWPTPRLANRSSPPASTSCTASVGSDRPWRPTTARRG